MIEAARHVEPELAIDIGAGPQLGPGIPLAVVLGAVVVAASWWLYSDVAARATLRHPDAAA